MEFFRLYFLLYLIVLSIQVHLPDGRRKMRTLYRFNITDNIIVDGRPKIIGHYEKVENLSEGLQKRLRENGLPLKLQEQLMAKG